MLEVYYKLVIQNPVIPIALKGQTNRDAYWSINAAFTRKPEVFLKGYGEGFYLPYHVGGTTWPSHEQVEKHLGLFAFADPWTALEFYHTSFRYQQDSLHRVIVGMMKGTGDPMRIPTRHRMMTCDLSLGMLKRFDQDLPRVAVAPLPAGTIVLENFTSTQLIILREGQ